MYIARDITLIVFILLLSSKSILSLTCFSCEECDDPFENEDVEEVTSNSSDLFCIKSRDIRDKVTRNITENCKESYSYNEFISLGPAVYCCETDLCNGADRRSLGLILILGWIFNHISVFFLSVNKT